MGRNYPYPLDVAVRRLVAHGAAREVLSKVKNTRKSSAFPWFPQKLVCDPELRLFAQSFLQLQEQRENADYDHDLIHTKRDAEGAIILANDAIDQLEKAKKNEPLQVQAICVAVVAKDRNRMRFRQ